jgi:hypothetical protein
MDVPLTAGPDKSSVLLMRPTLERPKSVNCLQRMYTLVRQGHIEIAGSEHGQRRSKIYAIKRVDV